MSYRRFFKNVINAVIIVMLTFDLTSGEYFSSVDSLKRLGDIELGLVEAFRDYLKMQEKEFETYSKFIEHVKTQHRIALEDTEDYLGNPINAFTLIKRMVTDWNHLHGFIKESQARQVFRQMLNEFHQKQQIPDESELKGTVKGLARLQKVYDLHAYDLANGRINGIYYGTELSWHDCFEIAANLYDQKDLILAVNWFEMALKKLNEIENEEKNYLQQKIEIESLEYLALINYELGYSDKAIEYIDELLELVPNHHTRHIYSFILNSPPKKKRPLIKEKHSEWYGNYTRLCRGEQVPEREFVKLKCKIENLNKPSFMLAPLKIEQLNLDPEVNVYHGLLNDVQIERILTEAENKMMRSKVKNGTASVASEMRISQQAWLNYKSPIMQTVYKMVTDITGFDLKNAESMQIANYGIGGQYDPHNDFFGAGGFSDTKGDRLATNMFYLSNVEQGGFTVFPKINLYSRPVKGALIIWHNLHKSLDPDYRTLHAGCPVIKGSKRIGNIWVHSGYQEFKRPCSLENDAVKSLHLRNWSQIKASIVN